MRSDFFSASDPLPDAFRLLDERREADGTHAPTSRHTLRDLASWEEVGARAQNDFEEVVFDAYPLLRRLRRAMAQTGPRISLLSGSGATLFAAYDEEEGARAGMVLLQEGFPETRFLLTHTRGESPDPYLKPGVEG